MQSTIQIHVMVLCHRDRGIGTGKRLAAILARLVVKLAVLKGILEVVLEHTHGQMMPGPWITHTSDVTQRCWRVMFQATYSESVE